MPAATYASAERAALAADLLRLGPDAPTLDQPWRARDLAAHLVLRERRPDAAAGIALAAVAPWTRRVQVRLADLPYPELVDRFRSGPPAWSPVRRPKVDEAANLLEFLVHHEDLLRAQPGWVPRELPADLRDEAWRRLRRMGRMLGRRVPCTVRLEVEQAEPTGQGVSTVTIRPGAPRVVTLRGPVLELLLYAFGRGRAAHVDASGDADAVAVLPHAFGGF